MPRFLVKETPRHGRATVRGGELRRLRDVLRLGVGDRVEVFDGEGRSWLAEVAGIDATSAELAILGELEGVAESPLRITLAVALPKASKLDWVVEKATELGVATVLPFLCRRALPAAPEPERLARWRRLAEAAARQCGRTRCPAIAEPAPFAAVLAQAQDHDQAILFWEGAASRLELPGDPRRLLVVTGPEGGFAPEEVDAALAAGFRTASLGPRVLRAETAAIVAVAVCQLRWGDLGAGRG